VVKPVGDRWHAIAIDGTVVGTFITQIAAMAALLEDGGAA
jgi:hypothetical protein